MCCIVFKAMTAEFENQTKDEVFIKSGEIFILHAGHCESFSIFPVKKTCCEAI